MNNSSVKQGKNPGTVLISRNTIVRDNYSLKQKALTGLHLLGYTLLLSHVSFIPYAYASPTGGTVVGGAGTITQSGVTTDIIQQSSSMAIDWSSYDLSSDEIVNYYQPDSSSLSLNRILSNDPSQINGQINANGHVILVNPNGLFFGDNASVNVGGLIASGLDISPDDFMNGNYIFNEVLGTNGTVINHGLINAATGGNVTLLGKQVQNQGVISANLGAVNMAAGKQAVLTFDSQGLIGISITKDILQDELGIDPAVLNSGDINANGGRILLTASQSQDIFSRAVNIGDLTQATSVVVNADGSFDLTGGADVVNSGTLNASTTNPNTDGGTIALLGQNITSSGTITADAEQGNGGNIELHAVDTTLLTQNSITSARAETQGQGGIVKILGDKVGLFDQSLIDVSGANGGGLVLTGGDYQGQNTLIRNASRTYVGSNVNIIADALQNGDGGKIINWGNDYTWFYGTASAKGGANSGNGGFVEISGKNGLSFDGAVDTTAANGETGTLLFDPVNIRICNASSCSEDSATGSPPDYIFSATTDLPATIFQINETTLQDLLYDANIQLVANSNITIDNLSDDELGLQINSSSGGSLTIAADANGDGIGAFSMNAGDTIRTQGGSVSISGASVQVGSIDTQGTSPTGGTSGDGTNGGAISLTSSAGNITVNGTLNSSGGDAADGASTGQTYVGGSAGTITLNSGTNNIILNDDITAAGGNGINGGVAGSGATIGLTAANIQLNNNLLIEAGNAASVAITGVINYNGLGSSGSLSVRAGDNISLGAVLDGSSTTYDSDTLDLTLRADTDVDSTGVVQISGNIATQGGMTDINGVSISAGNITTTGKFGRAGGSVDLAATSTDTLVTGINVGNITTEGGSTSADGWGGGNVTLTATGSAITMGSITTNGSNGSGNNDDGGAAGTINISNSGSVTVSGSLSAIGGNAGASNATNGAGGDITIAGVTPSDVAGAVNISGSTIANSAAVTITAESISAGSITTSGNTTRIDDTGQSGGAVTLKATTETGTGISVGAITTTGGTASNGNNGEVGGNVTLASAGGEIATGSINTSGSDGDGSGDDGGNAGTIGIYNSGAVTVTGTLTANGGVSGNTAYDNDGVGGAITIAGISVDGTGIPSPDTAYSAGAVQITGAVSAYGADVSIDAASIIASTIDTSGAISDGVSGSPQQNGGAVELVATGNIEVGAITTDGGTATRSADARGAGDVTITTTSGGITINGAISAQGGGFEHSLDTGNGGAGGHVTLNSNSGAIAVTGAINTSGSAANGDNNDGGDAGDIDINSVSGTIALTSLTTNGGGETNNGTGGDAGHIDLNTGSSATNAVTITGALTANGGSNGNGIAGNADYIALHSDSGTMTIQGNVSATGAAAADVTLSADTLQLSTTAAQSISGNTVTLASTNPVNAIQLQQDLTVTAATDVLVSGDISYTGSGATLAVTADGNVEIDGIAATSALGVTLTADNDDTYAGNVTVGGDVSTMGGSYQAYGVDYVGSSNSIATYGGQVTIGAASVTTGDIDTTGASIGGMVSITSDTATYSPASAGGITVGAMTTTGNINNAGGTVALTTVGNGDIAVNGAINTNGGILTGNAGTITVTSANGDVSASGSMSASGGNLSGTSADVTIVADAVQLTGATAQSISGNNITITSNTNSIELQHNLTINAVVDAIFNGDINYTGAAGTLDVRANSNVAVDGITSGSSALTLTLGADDNHSGTGDITVGGAIDTGGGNYAASGVNYGGSTNTITTRGGQVAVDAAAITTGDINTIRAGGAGGLVRLTSDTATYSPASSGGVTVGTIVTAGDTGAAGGQISVEALAAGDIDVTGSVVSAAGGSGATAGAITVSSVNGNVAIAGSVNANGDSGTATTGIANTIDLRAQNGALALQGGISATGATNADVTVDAQTVRFTGATAQSISGNRVAVVSASSPVELQNSLTVNAATSATISGGIDYTRAALGELNVTSNGNITLDGITSSGGALNITLAADSDNNTTGSATIDGNVSTNGGDYSVSGVNYDESMYTVDTGSGNATITMNGNVVLGTMTTDGDLAVNAGGASGITQAAGTTLTVNGTSDFTSTASGADVVLDGIGNQLQGTVSANLAGNLTLSNDNSLVIGNLISTTANSTVTLTTTGDITADTGASGTNIMASNIVLDANSGIGSSGNALTTNASTLDVITNHGNINMANTGNVQVDMMRTDSGDITFNNAGAVTVDRIATDETSGLITLRIDNGDLLGLGAVPKFNYADADIAGYSADIIINGGNLGSLTRRLVIYAPGNISAVSVISFDPAYLPEAGLEARLNEVALVNFSATDTLAAVAGEQVTEVEELQNVDPAIFTEVHNYNLAEISIKLPKDQNYNEEE